MNNFSNKDPAEDVTLTFEFDDELASDDPLLSIDDVAVTVTRGADASPAAMLAGAAAIASGGLKVTQSIIGGIAGCNYRFKCTASSASETLVRAGLLRVRDAT